MSSTYLNTLLAAGQLRPCLIAVSGSQSTVLTGPDEIACVPFDPRQHAPSSLVVPTFVFCSVLNVSVAGETASLELFNLTDGISVVTLTLADSLTPREVRSAALPVSSGIPKARKLYSLRLKRVGGTATDPVVCKYAALEVLFK